MKIGGEEEARLKVDLKELQAVGISCGRRKIRKRTDTAVAFHPREFKGYRIYISVGKRWCKVHDRNWYLTTITNTTKLNLCSSSSKVMSEEVNFSQENDICAYIWGNLKYSSQKFYAPNFQAMQPPIHFHWLWKRKATSKVKV
uniref:Uncharacterized protein n=2 Tax=Oryza sativa subsp. japonica TaxID=39947 RepID=Q53ML3_ORYSJ|nr:hypothetical protein LOC_Os11g17320 [Oryza sativa Japonica Group]ABA92732.1 hypothetical protein LOC_Os11g17320 [Oryza sativa Japonica Group]